jgi:hypothetical protein
MLTSENSPYRQLGEETKWEAPERASQGLLLHLTRGAIRASANRP